MEQVKKTSILTKALRLIGLAAPEPVQKRPDALRLGVLGAAKVTPTSLISPSNEMDSVKIVSIGARDIARAAQFAQNHGIPKHYGSYEEVLADKDVEAVYIPLLNGNHAEWTIKALEAGKHVLCEKPLTASEYEAKQVEAAARKSGKVVMEAFHNRYHPLLRRIKSIIDSGEIGSIKEVHARMQFPWILSRFLDPDTSIHWDPARGGGNLLEAGCYCVNAIRFFSTSEPESISKAAALAIIPGKAETGISATLQMKNGVIGELFSNFKGNWLENSLRVVGTNGELFTNNFVAPHMFHYLSVTSAGPGGPTKRTEKLFQSGWSSYRHQLEAFVDAVKKGDKVETDATDAVHNLRAVEMIFDAAGLPRRGKQPSDNSK